MIFYCCFKFNISVNFLDFMFLLLLNLNIYINMCFLDLKTNCYLFITCETQIVNMLN